MDRRTVAGTVAALALSLCAAASASSATNGSGEDESAGQRVTLSRHYARDGRNQAVPDKVARTEHALASDDGADGKPSRSRARKAGEVRSQSINTDFWFYAADIELFGDHDGDGYFHGIDLLFDADTLYDAADVYAVVYLSRDGGPWLEYAATDVFSLYGATSDDDYVIVTELVSGYPAGSYDVLIELWDTWDDSFVAEIGPADTAALAFLPLEDTGRDTPYDEPSVIVVEEGGGGSFEWLSLAGLAVLFLGKLLYLQAGRRAQPSPLGASPVRRRPAGCSCVAANRTCRERCA